MADISALVDEKGVIRIAALDHRGSIVKYVQSENISEFKRVCVEAFSPYVKAALLDPEYGMEGIAAAKAAGLALLLPREKTGYVDDGQGLRKNVLYEGYPVSKLVKLGADSIKLLVYYNSDAPNANDQKKIVDSVSQETHAAGLPFLLEIVTYPVEGAYFHKGDSILAGVEDLHEFADILKLEYPMETANSQDSEGNDLESAIPYLDQITSAAGCPWILLSRGMPFKKYKKALEISYQEGCRGYAVGRAIWQEIANLPDWEKKVEFIRTTGKERIKSL